MDLKIDKIRSMLLLQYSNIESKTEDQIKLYFESIDWTTEFKKLKRQHKYLRISYAFYMIIIAGLLILTIFYPQIKFNSLIIAGIIGGLLGILKVLQNITDKIRILGLLHEIYKK